MPTGGSEVGKKPGVEANAVNKSATSASASAVELRSYPILWKKKWMMTVRSEVIIVGTLSVSAGNTLCGRPDQFNQCRVLVLAMKATESTVCKSISCKREVGSQSSVVLALSARKKDSIHYSNSKSPGPDWLSSISKWTSLGAKRRVK